MGDKVEGSKIYPEYDIFVSNDLIVHKTKVRIKGHDGAWFSIPVNSSLAYGSTHPNREDNIIRATKVFIRECYFVMRLYNTSLKSDHDLEYLDTQENEIERIREIYKV